MSVLPGEAAQGIRGDGEGAGCQPPLLGTPRPYLSAYKYRQEMFQLFLFGQCSSKKPSLDGRWEGGLRGRGHMYAYG